MRDIQRRRRSVLESLLEWECTPSSGDMTLPVSSYEELLARVRSLTHETIQLQRELTTPLIDHNENERPLTTSCCEAISTCDNKKRGVASVGWTTPTGGTQQQPGPLSGDGGLRRPPGSSTHRRSGSNPADEGAPGPTGAAVQQFGWSRRETHRQHADTLHLQNGSVGNEELSAASVLARLGVTVDARGNLVRDRPAALLSGRIAVSNKENVMDEPKEEDEKKTAELRRTKNNDDSLSEVDGAGGDFKMTSSATQTQQDTQNLSALYRGTWPVERSLWHSGPSSIGDTGGSKSITQDVPSVVSFTSSMSSASGCLPADEVAAARRTYSQQQLGAKVEMVYSLLSMLGTHDREDMSRTLLAMSSSADSCIAMRQSGCLPLLVQLLHAPDSDADTRQRAAQVLHNMVHSHPDDKRSRREARVLRLLEQVREYCDSLREMIRAAAAAEDGRKAVEAATRLDQEMLLLVLRANEKELCLAAQHCSSSLALDDMERHPGPTIAALMKLSFDEEHRHAMCQLGGLHAVAELIQVDHEAHGSTTSDQYCVTLRRYAGMALTNLTFGDGANKALLCSFRQFMKALVAQLKSPSEDLRQVTASVLRNLSWRADGASKQTLREVGAVSGLMEAAMEGRKESTLKSILSALWNLSAHCSINKVDICAVEGALGFLVDMLSYKAPSKTLAIVENAGGILRNISSHIAVREDYRAILREHSCLQVLLQQLKSPSLTVVSNACGTLWNLSARCAEDQRALWDMGAVSMLRSLVHSKHKMISMGSSAALKNLLSAKPNNNFPPLDSTAKGLGLPALPSLYARKQRALEQELDQTLSETCDNIEPSTSPSASTIGLRDEKFVFSTTERCFGSTERRQSRMCHSYQHHPPSYRYHSKGVVARSDSRDSVTSTLSDTVYERVSRTVINPFTYGQAVPTDGMSQGLTGSLSDSGRINSQMSGGENSDQRFLRRYCNSMKEREDRNAEPLNLSIEDNPQHPVLQHSHELYQHSRLGQISEAKSSDPTESQKNMVDLSQEIRNEVDAKFSDKIEECDERVSSTVQSDTGSAKQPTNLFYDSMRSPHQRSAFGPVVAGSYGQPSNKPQYQHLTQQQNCVTTSHTAVRTKYSDFAYDDDTEAQEQPVDYSLKYVESSAQHGDIDVATTESSNIKTGSDQEGGGPGVYQTSRNTSRIRGKQNQNDLDRGYPYRHPGSIHVSKNMKLKVVYGDYAETDLDQPTDYSLKYAEENEEIEFEKNHEISSREQERPESTYYDGADAIHEDTLKTYCTEGTPYETPYNFSNATSMSDLHCEPPTPVSEESGGKKRTENYSKDGSIEDNAIRSVDGNETSNSEDVSNFDKDFTEKGPQIKALPPAPRQPLKRLQSGLSSGLLSPEKPVQYCVEGTPGSFSRVSSLSSLSSVPANVDNTLQTPAADTDHSVSEPEQKPQTDGASSLAESGDKAVVERQIGNAADAVEDTAGQTEDMKEEQHRGEREGKVVTFGGADLYAEETPLMFSRCSSLCSLSSIEQHSIHDDRSSVISDFSRRTSGIVSPSELPDSPTQTVPTSPRHTRPPVEFTSRLMEQRAQPVPANTHHAEISNTVKGSVFEDHAVAFKEEDTPVEFSRATSLSSLTIDDEPKISNDAMLKEVVGKPSSYTRSSNIPTGIHHAGRLELVGRDREEGMEKQDVEKEKRGELADCCELAPVSEGEEENDEDMLAACINIGMQNSRQRQCQYSIENATKNVPATTHQPTGISRLQSSRVQSHMSRGGRPSGIPVKTAVNNSLRQGKVNQPTQHEGVGEGPSKSLNNMVVMLCNLVGTSDHPVQVPGGTCCEDAVRTFCDEGTPANISHTGSHSDLSVLSLPGDRDETEAQKEETHLEGANGAEESVDSGDREAERPELSDDSSNFSGDNDNILAECIQSGMPKAHQASRRILAQPGGMNIASSSAVPSQQKKKIPTVVPGVTVSVLPPQEPSASTYRPPAHHLCGLSHSSPRPINRKPSPLSCSPQPKATDQHVSTHKPTVKNDTGATQNTRAPKSKLSGILQGPNMLPHCLAAKDEVEVYAFEGSPNECCDGCAVCLQRFSSGDALPKTAAPDTSLGCSTENTPLEVSHAASLSSLNVDDEEDDDEFNTVMKAVQPSTSGPHNIGPSQSSEVPISITYSSESGPRSCVSPLNKSIDSVTAEVTAAHVMVGSDGSWGDHSDKHDDSTSSKLLNKTSSVSEDVVTVLSRNDSLSSLSVDSFGSTEPTPSEQALLEQCISSGMPKSKSEGGCGKARIVVPVSTKKKITGGVCKIPLAIGDRRQGDGERSGPVIPGVPLQKLELKPVARIHCGSRVGVVGAVGSDIPCLNLQNDVHTCDYDIGQIPKNGVDASAALGLKEMAAGVDGSIAAITSVQNLRDHPGNSSDLPQNIRIMETESSSVYAARLANEAVSTDAVLDVADYEKQKLKASVHHLYAQSKENENDSVFRKLTETEDRRDMKLEVSKRASGVCCLSNKADSPHGSPSDDNKSPFSSGESPSSDFGSDEKVEECNRKREDPDAMIASLDHLTEELVQQAQGMHVQKDKNKDCSIMKQSDTWNEDTSPNDVSFPSMSTSAPLVASFKSEDDAITLPELIKEDDSTNKISEERQGSSLTDSHMIEVEAGKLAVAVQAEGENLPYPSAEEMEQSLASINSVDLDAIKPPSMMGSLVSLTTSLSGQLDNVENAETREHHNSSSLPPHQPRNNGIRLECRHSRKKSLPAGMMVRRALGNSNHNGSIENLQDNTSVSSSCNSHLDNIKPPSAMEELIDIVDMENSMVSVASITSEVADSSTKDQSASEQSPGNSDGIFELIKPAASIMAEVYVTAMCTSVRTSSASDCLDNINPPSAFNEIADLADPESTIEPGTETICSDTEMCTEEPGCAHSMEKLDEVDAPDFPSDTSRRATPSDHYMSSSAESTPKKHGQLTPKQKRQLAKERYKTYTIPAEEEISIRKSVDDTRVVPPQPEISFQALEPEACGSLRSPENLEHTVQEGEKEKGHNKVTPKQRRLEDRQRFQTRVLDKSPSVDVEHGIGAIEQDCTVETEEHTKAIHIDAAKQKTSRIKTLKQKRAEAKERFQTRTLSEESRPQNNCSEADDDHIQTNDGTETFDPNCPNVGFVEALLRIGPDDIESLLERDANIVITTINDSRRHNSESSELPSSDEMLLECETLSLISIESESEQNSNIFRYGKRRGSDLLTRESSVTEEPGMSNTEQAFVEEKVVEEIEAYTEDRESVADSETSQEDGSDDGNNDDLPKTRGPRIVKPEERLKREESADSNCTDDSAPQNKSPKSIRGRRKALYSSPVAKRATVPPVAGKVRSSIPVVSGAASNVKSTKASVLKQTGRGTPQWCVSKTPPSSTEGRLLQNSSPKSNRSGRKQQLNPSSASPPAKTSSSSSRNTAITHIAGKDGNERDVKDPRFKPPERQGTFTKDEPNSIMPMSMPPLSPTKTRIPVPASVSTPSAKLESKPKKTCGAITQCHSVNSTASKIKIYKEKSAPTLTRSLGQSRFAKNCSNDISTSGKGSPTGNAKSLTKAATVPGRNGTTRSPPAPRVRYKRGSIGAQEGMKTSLSNQSLQSNDSGKMLLKQGTVQPQRSNSNSSLNSVASGGGSSSRRTTGTRKEVTSKIASLWKRVEESKNKQKAAKKDTRVWITATHVENGSDVNTVSSDLSAPRLVRSSTFEGLPSMSTNNDEVGQDTKVITETAKANKTKTEIRCSSHRGKCGSTGSCNSEDFTNFTNQESSNIPRQVAEVAGMVIVQPAGKGLAASGCFLSKDRDDVPSQEVVRRKQRNGSGNTGLDPETPKRLSRLGSFIRIDSPEEEVVGNRESKSVSRTPASAIVQPFNYIPPTSTAGSHIPTAVTSTAKRSDSYMGGLGNMEQVRCDQAEVMDEHMSEFNTVSMRVTTV